MLRNLLGLTSLLKLPLQWIVRSDCIYYCLLPIEIKNLLLLQNLERCDRNDWTEFFDKNILWVTILEMYCLLTTLLTSDRRNMVRKKCSPCILFEQRNHTKMSLILFGNIFTLSIITRARVTNDRLSAKT